MLPCVLAQAQEEMEVETDDDGPNVEEGAADAVMDGDGSLQIDNAADVARYASAKADQ